MNKTIKNYLYNVSYQILIIILPIITAPHVSRVLGPEGVGTFSYTHNIANYFFLLSMMGVNSYGSRSIAAIRDDKQALSRTFSSILTLQVISSVTFFTLYIAYVMLLEKQYTQLALIQSLYVLSAALDINWFFFGLEEFRLTVFRRIVVKLLTVLGILNLVQNAADLWLYTLLMCLEPLVGQLYLWLHIRKYTSIVWVKISEAFSHLKSMVLLFIPSAAAVVYRSLSMIILGAISGMREVGLFDYSWKIIMMSLGLLTALGTVMLPRMTNLLSNNKLEQSNAILRQSMTFAMFLGCGIAIGYAAIAPEFAVVFYGKEFMEAVPLMQGLSVTVPFIAWANVIRTQYVIPNNLEKVLSASTISGLAVNVIAAIALVPAYGAMGAVIASVLTEGTVFLVQTVLVRKRIAWKDYVKASVPFIMFGALMFATVRFCADLMKVSLTGLVLEIVAGAGIYVICSSIYLILKRGNGEQFIFRGRNR